jgi:hypothetical protein
MFNPCEHKTDLVICRNWLPMVRQALGRTKCEGPGPKVSEVPVQGHKEQESPQATPECLVVERSDVEGQIHVSNQEAMWPRNVQEGEDWSYEHIADPSKSTSCTHRACDPKQETFSRAYLCV